MPNPYRFHDREQPVPASKYAGLAFNPTSLVNGFSGGFWRADMGVSVSGSNVTAWADQSTNSNNLNSIGGTPLWSSTRFNTSFAGVGFGNAAGFGTGTADQCAKTSIAFNSATLSMFLLFTENGTGRSATLLANGAANDFNAPSCGSDFPSTTSWEAYAFGTGPGDLGNGGAAITTSASTPQMTGTICDGAHANMYLAITAQGAQVACTVTFGGASNPGFYIGNSTANGAATMVVAYCLLTSKALAAGDLTNLKSWTNSNWGTSF